MTKLNEVIFVDSYPKIDLHGYDRATARVAINDFIRDNYKLGNEVIVIIHGIGSGILREEVHLVLKRHPLVLDYKTYYFNNGCTIVQIRKKD